MTPAHGLRHQKVLGNLHVIFYAYFKEKPYRPFIAPTDVIFDDFNIVQPDLLVLCDPDKITEANIKGTPDLIVEIVTPSTKLRDKRDKKGLYERFGVREYLIVLPDDEMVEQYRLVDGRYLSDLFNWDQKLPSFAFPELELPLWEVFEKQVEENRSGTEKKG